MKFLEIFTSGSRLLFWGIVPAGAVVLLILTVSTQGADLKQWCFVLGLDFVFLLLALGLYDPRRFAWAFRSFLVACFLILAAGMINDFLHHKGFDSVHILLVCGVPALLFAIRGFRPRKQRFHDPYQPPPPIHPK